MNIRPLVENLNAAPRVGRLSDATEEDRPRLLELRTDSGLLYVCPSGWERIRLLWTFRHFHILPPQLLSRSDQRLIERLSRSALVTPSLPVPRSTVFGVVENLHAKPGDAALSFGEPDTPVAEDNPPQAVRALRFPQSWGALGTVIAICLVLLLAKLYVKRVPAASEPTGQAAGQAVVRAAVRVPPPTLPVAEKVEHVAVPAEPAPVARKAAPLTHVRSSVIESSLATPPAEPAAIAPSNAGPRLAVAELPQGHLVQPRLSNSNLVGAVDLRALIGADGSVKDVTMVSGDPRLAEAGIRAVRRWHYPQSPAPAADGEREALIRMNFFGKDAVSITSLAR